MDKIYSQTFFTSVGEGNAEQCLSIPVIIAKCIDVATDHANQLGVGNPDMTDIKGGWVLARFTLEMTAYPPLNSFCTLSTWVEAFNRHFSERSFKLSGPDGIVYGYARSVWMVIGTDTHANLGLAHLSLPDGYILDLKAPIRKQTRHIPIVGNDVMTPPEGTLVATHDNAKVRFHYCDLDGYRHVNTVRYVEMLLNQYPLAVHDALLTSRLELSFLHEAACGADLELLRNDTDADSGTLSSFLLKDPSSGTDLMFARVLMTPRHNQEIVK